MLLFGWSSLIAFSANLTARAGASRVGKKLDWDGPKMRALNAPEAAQYVKRTYRKGFELA